MNRPFPSPPESQSASPPFSDAEVEGYTKTLDTTTSWLDERAVAADAAAADATPEGAFEHPNSPALWDESLANLYGAADQAERAAHFHRQTANARTTQAKRALQPDKSHSMGTAQLGDTIKGQTSIDPEQARGAARALRTSSNFLIKKALETDKRLSNELEEQSYSADKRTPAKKAWAKNTHAGAANHAVDTTVAHDTLARETVQSNFDSFVQAAGEDAAAGPGGYITNHPDYTPPPEPKDLVEVKEFDPFGPAEYIHDEIKYYVEPLPDSNIKAGWMPRRHTPTLLIQYPSGNSTIDVVTGYYHDYRKNSLTRVSHRINPSTGEMVTNVDQPESEPPHHPSEDGLKDIVQPLVDTLEDVASQSDTPQAFPEDWRRVQELVRDLSRLYDIGPE